MIHIKPKGRLDEVVLIKIDLTPFDKYRLFQPARRIWNLSTSEFQTEFASKEDPRGRPSIKKVNDQLYSQKIFFKKKKKNFTANAPTGGTSPTGIRLDFPKFTFKLETTLKQISNIDYPNTGPQSHKK